MTEFFEAISSFGFPVVVAAYLLFRFEKKIDRLTEVIDGKDGLIAEIRDLRKTIQSSHDE